MLLGRTKAMRESMQRRFKLPWIWGLDARLRMKTVTNTSPETYLWWNKQCMSTAVGSIISCIQLHSFSCGRLKSNKWNSSVLLSDFELSMTEEDRCLLKDCINLTLGPNNLERIKYHTCTQKSESVNRAYLKSNPKCTTSSRNFESIIHKDVHSLNQGHGSWTFKLCESVGAPVAKGSTVIHHQKQHILKWNSNYWY